MPSERIFFYAVAIAVIFLWATWTYHLDFMRRVNLISWNIMLDYFDFAIIQFCHKTKPSNVVYDETECFNR